MARFFNQRVGRVARRRIGDRIFDRVRSDCAPRSFEAADVNNRKPVTCPKLETQGAPHANQVALTIASEKLKPHDRETVGIWLQCPFLDPGWGSPAPFQITLPTMPRNVVL